MGALLAEVRQAAVGVRRNQCPVKHAMDALDGEDRDDLYEALADNSIPGSVIHRVLVNRGFAMGKGAVATHRGDGCSCGKTRG
jgi:hypothetical protein